MRKLKTPKLTSTKYHWDSFSKLLNQELNKDLNKDRKHIQIFER